MNDRYLYRAKRTNNGEWVEGYYAVARDRKGLTQHNILIADNDIGYFKWIVVDPSTVCQCTGLKDKNGKLIWESDICIVTDGTLDEEDGYFRLDWEIDRAMFEFEGTGICANFDNVSGYDCEVAGNIFDNPELLEVGE